MAHLTIRLGHCACPDTCVLCGKKVSATAGPHLCLDESADVVCRDCGRREAPSLVALLDLAKVAERVGRIGRHTLVPPLGALLDLARAAEDYLDTSPQRQQRLTA
jgi:hypothetical protein